jgi:hypothetical protein
LAPAESVVVIGVPGLEWADVTTAATPNLAVFSSHAALGQLSVRTVSSSTCPADAWLTVSAGPRAEMPKPDADAKDAHRPCPGLPDPTLGRIPGWNAIRELNEEGKYGASVGSLGETLAGLSGTVSAFGRGGAAVTSDTSGDIEGSYYSTLETIGQAAHEDRSLTVVDLGGLSTRSESLAEQDALFGGVIRRVPSTATVLVMGTGGPTGSSTLQYVALSSPEVQSGLLTSSSTQEAGLVTLTDVSPTLTALMNLPTPEQFVGAPIVSDGSQQSWLAMRQGFLDRSAKAETYAESVGYFFGALILLNLCLYVFSGFALRLASKRPERNSVARALKAASTLALILGAISVATFLTNLVPWWRAEVRPLALVATVIVIAAVLGGITLVLRRMIDRVGAITLVTVLTLAVDVLTGGSLQRLSIMGYSPVVAGRFYGFGNIAFAVFASSALLSLAWLAYQLRRSRWKTTAVTVCAVLAVCIVGLPALGADFGGMLALTAGAAVFLIMLKGLRVTPRVAGLVAAGSIGLVALVSFADWLRPADSRTHLGRFVQQVLDGEGFEIVSRKLSANIGIFFSNWLTLLVVAAVVFVALVLRGPGREGTHVLLADAVDTYPELRAALFGWVVAMGTGFLVNDSGIAIPAVGLMLEGPLVIALTCDARVHAKPTATTSLREK